MPPWTPDYTPWHGYSQGPHREYNPCTWESQHSSARPDSSINLNVYSSVVVNVGRSIHVLFGPVVELVGADGLALVLGFLHGLEVVVVGVPEEPVGLAH
jgi:hypothetical protein